MPIGVYKRITGKVYGMSGKHHTDEAKEKISKAKEGQNNPSWRGGIMREDMKIRSVAKYREWRKLVYEKVGYVCVSCGSKERLRAHHILSVREHPELCYEVDNGQILCHECHKKEHYE